MPAKRHRSAEIRVDQGGSNAMSMMSADRSGAISLHS